MIGLMKVRLETKLSREGRTSREVLCNKFRKLINESKKGVGSELFS